MLRDYGRGAQLDPWLHDPSALLPPGDGGSTADGIDRVVERKETLLDVMTTDGNAAPTLGDRRRTDRTMTSVNPGLTDLTGYVGAEAGGSTPYCVLLGHNDSCFCQPPEDQNRTIAPILDATGSIDDCDPRARDVTYGTRTEGAMRRLNSRLELQSARIAGMLHDEASQFLASAHIAIADIAHDVPPPVQARLQQVRLHLDEVTEQLRRICHQLHPDILDVLGPIGAITSIAQAFTRRTGVRLAIDAQLDEPCPAAGAAVFRFVEEALTNIGAHARATSASIAIAREGSRLVCAVCDDGVGFDVAATLERRGDHSLGLMLIRDRLEAVGGTLHITSTPQQGTYLCAVIPQES
jgi:signal transduction histidine kinase